MQAKAKLRLIAPTHQNRTMPLRPVNADLRKREYLTPHEIEKLIRAARKSGKTEAQAQRNATLVLVAYRHGLRAQELCDLEWSHRLCNDISMLLSIVIFWHSTTQDAH